MTFRTDVEHLGGFAPGAGVEPVPVEPAPASTGAASAFDVDRLLAATAGYCVAHGSAATADVADEPRRLDLDHVLSFSTTHVEVDGETVPAWADLSGVYPTADGRHLQIHCNFPHHASGVVDLLGTAHDRAEVAAAIADHDSIELETALVAAGLVAADVRTMREWDEHPHARATRELPVMTVEQIGDASPSTRGRPGLRVLDCSRVLAGPVAGRMLAAFGADVIRLGAPHLPSVPVCVMSTGFGKRNADADLRTGAGRRVMAGLLEGADVWIDAYRPGALGGYGFSPERAAELRPGIVVVQISAFDVVGPWAGRRGYDSIVQSTTGIRWAGGEFALGEEGDPADRGPTGLPVQALDYATGFTAAGVAGQLVAHQRRVGGSWLARLSLLRTRNWLVSMGGPCSYRPAPVRAAAEHLVTVDSDFGRLTAVSTFAGEQQAAPRRLGTSAPRW